MPGKQAFPSHLSTRYPAGSMALLLGLLATLYSFLSAPYGLADTDPGFMTGLAWRILEGQRPYIDFIYVRPPVSIYFQAAILKIGPENYALLGSRVAFYFEMAAIVWLSLMSLQEVLPGKVSLSRSWLAIAAYLLSVHNFAPMGWHTVDGLFFGAAGIFFLARNHRGGQVLGLLLLVLAAGCKQSFYPLPLVGAVLLLWRFPSREGLLPLIVATAALLGGLLWIKIQIPGQWNAMLDQTTVPGGGKDLLQTGFLNYLKALVYPLPLVLIWFFRKRPWAPLAGLLILTSVFLGPLIGHAWRAWQLQTTIGPSFAWARGMWLIALAATLPALWQRNREIMILLAHLGLAWCTGLSWGYATPSLHFTPILIGLMVAASLFREKNLPPLALPVTAIVAALVYSYLLSFPYREAPRSELDFDLGKVFPKAKGIYSSEENFEKSRELKLALDTISDPFTVLPAWPLAHYLTGRTPAFPVDWAHNAELDWPDTAPGLYRLLEHETFTVLVEKDKLDEARDSSRYGSLITGWVIDNYRVVDESQNFLLLRHPKIKTQSLD